MDSLPSRPKAIIGHFLISLAIVSTVLLLVFLVWYPSPYFQILGPAAVLMTLVGVDLVLGPLLTAILYKPGKKGLWFDMGFIAVVQAAALIYGTSVLYQERPQYVIFAVDRFVVLPRSELYPNPDVATPACDGVPRPCIAAAMLPPNEGARDEILQLAIDAGVEIEQQPQYWAPIEARLDEVLARTRPLAELLEGEPEAAARVQRKLEALGRAPDSVRYVPALNKRQQASTLILDAETAAILGVVAVDPWVARAP